MFDVNVPIELTDSNGVLYTGVDFCIAVIFWFLTGRPPDDEEVKNKNV